MSVEEIIQLQKLLEDNDATFRRTWQDTADLIFPRESNITEQLNSGDNEKYTKIYDPTAVIESERMASGLLTNLVPAGQKFFSLTTSDTEVQELDAVKSYMARATEILHEELFSSNFLLQLAETLRSLIVFGTGSIYVEWKQGLNFMDWDISRFQILENFQGQVDTIVLKFPKTAKQAYQRWGDKAGESIIEAVNDEKKAIKHFWFIHIVRPRQWRNPRFQDNMNMAFESKYINVKDKSLIDEGGFPEFPYMIPRWAKTTGEVHGRGIGTMILPQVRVLQRMKRDFIEVGNKFANPHREVLQSFEGDYDTTPGAHNEVSEIPSSYVDQNNFGNFPITKDILEMQQKMIVDVFYGDAFAPITSTGTGDRRNELEIEQRVAEAFRKIGSPIGRIESELFTPKITRCFMLLVRNGVIPPPPEELRGSPLKIMYKGPLSLAQQDAEVRASMRWVGAVGEMAQNPEFADVTDNVNSDKTVRRWGRVMGVNEDDIAKEEERDAKRAARQAAIEKQQALEAAQVAAGAYGQTTKAPEPGSAAEQLQEVAG